MKDLPMVTRNTTEEERKIIQRMQESIGAAKEAMRQYKRGAQKLYKIAEDAGEAEFSAEAFRVKAASTLALGQVETAHSVGTDAIVSCFEDAGPVLRGGGGGR